MGVFREDFRDKTETRKDKDIDFRMTEESEKMLEKEDITTSHNVKEATIKVTVEDDHRNASGEDRERDDEEEGSNKDRSREERDIHIGRHNRHVRRLKESDHEINGTKEGGETDDMEAKEHDVDRVVVNKGERDVEGSTGINTTVDKHRDKD